MRIGFFLAYRPEAELNNQGLGRYMAYLIKGLLKNNIDVIIATPYWSKASIEALLEDCGVEVNHVELLTTPQNPVLLQFYNSIRKLKRKEKKKRNQPFVFKVFLKRMLSSIVSTNNYLLFFLCAIFLFIMMIPLLVFKILLKIVSLSLYPITKNQENSTIRHLYTKTENKIKYLMNPKHLMNTFRFRELFRMMYDTEIQRLVTIINHNHDVDLWYCPTAFWPEFNRIHGKKVTCVPDLIPTDYPIGFSGKSGVEESFRDCSETIEKSKYCIVYDNYVKTNLLISRFGKYSDDIAVIPHGANLLDEQIAIHGTVDDASSTSVFARNKIEAFRNNYFRGNEYLKNFSFNDVKYMFYASQLRPNKNLLTLLKAYEHILRRKHRYIKLFLTCDLESDEEVKEFVTANRLQYDVISFINVPSQTLAALYHCAELVVNPTLFEGGFPFTFAEGASVGTPSIMSRIPQTESFVSQFGLDDTMLFDPFDWRDLADRMVWALDHKDELFDKQQPMFEYLKNRTWDVVAKEYIHSFERFLEIS